jgi:hypothetical protein
MEVHATVLRVDRLAIGGCLSSLVNSPLMKKVPLYSLILLELNGGQTLPVLHFYCSAGRQLFESISVSAWQLTPVFATFH